MYERMLDKQIKPSLEAMADYCGENGERFILLNQWLGKTFETEQQIVFPYGNQYGWGVAHRKKRTHCDAAPFGPAVQIRLRAAPGRYPGADRPQVSLRRRRLDPLPGRRAGTVRGYTGFVDGEVFVGFDLF